MPDGRFCQQWIWGRLPAQRCASQVSYRAAASFARVPSVVTMEACWGAGIIWDGCSWWWAEGARVRPALREAQKNNNWDADASAEAETQPTSRRCTGRLRGCGRTRLMHQLRAILLERGITVPPAYAASAASRPWYAPQHQDRLTPKCEGATTSAAFMQQRICSRASRRDISGIRA